MSCSDPIADMLTRIRNAQMSERDAVDIPHSKIKAEMARVLKKEGFISDFVVEGSTIKTLRVYLKYSADMEPVIQGIKRESKPGLRKYSAAADVPKVLGGLGIAILSTSSGIMTDKDARSKSIGGEVLCLVW